MWQKDASHSWKALLNCLTRQECYQLASILYRVNFQELVLQRASLSHEGHNHFTEIIQTRKKNRRPWLRHTRTFFHFRAIVWYNVCSKVMSSMNVRYCLYDMLRLCQFSGIKFQITESILPLSRWIWVFRKIIRRRCLSLVIWMCKTSPCTVHMST